MSEQSKRPTAPPLEGNHSKRIRFEGDGQWEAVPLEPYKKDSDSWRGITRRELIGGRGESPHFHLRYFEIEPGGFSTLEKHEHEHVVIAQRGRGEAQFDCYVVSMEPGDVVYVAPSDAHQFRCAPDAR